VESIVRPVPSDAAPATGIAPREAFSPIETFLEATVLGQPALVRRLLIALLADGHLLVEGAPGLAKTRAVRALAACLDAGFHRIQFTPDLLPADLTGTDVFQPADGGFVFAPGPLFHNLVLADEINRAPARVQSALLEAMAERQVTVGRTTHPLPDPFLVLATLNPFDHEGTWPLPESQLDRFLLHVRVDYPDAETEHRILRLAREEALGGGGGGDADGLHDRSRIADPIGAADPSPDATPRPPRLERTVLGLARREVLSLHLAPALERYLVALVRATRAPGEFGEDLAPRLEAGAGPRASIALERCARAHAWLCGRDYVSPADVQALAADVLRHRVRLSAEAEADGDDPGTVIDALVARVPAP
jgi:MoxR-like ATPase